MHKIASIFLFFFLFFFLSVQITSGQTAAQNADKILNQALLEKNPDKRKEVVIALSLGGAKSRVFSLLEEALDDEDVQVRLAACASLAALQDKQSIPMLEKALKDDVPEVSFAAAQALWQLDHPAGKEVLMAVLAGEKKTSSGYITKQKRDAMRMMKNPGGLFKFAVKRGIGFAPIPGLGTGIASMESLMKDSGISGRALAALLLSRDTDAASLEVLRDALSDKDSSVRAAAVHSIALRNQPEVRKDLIPLFDDKKDTVRYRAAAAYLRLETIEIEQKQRPASNRSEGSKKRR
jgi:HEAT repeat protein